MDKILKNRWLVRMVDAKEGKAGLQIGKHSTSDPFTGNPAGISAEPALPGPSIPRRKAI